MNPEFSFGDLTLVLNFFKGDFSMCSMYLLLENLTAGLSLKLGLACVSLNISKLLITICQCKVMGKNAISNLW